MTPTRKFSPAAMLAVAAVLFALAVVFCHRMLQDSRVYAMFSGFVQTYELVDNGDGTQHVRRVAKPFVSPDNDNMLSWDAEHYDEIRRYLYDPSQSWSGENAFYPLFPLLWRLFNFSPMGIAVFNWILYAVGLVLMALFFGNRLPRWSWLLLFCAPMLVVFMIPYSEALFFLCIVLGMVGIVCDRYWLYFVGFFMASTTRAAGNIMLVAWIIVDILVALNARSSARKCFLSVLCHLAPVVLGVLAVMLFQHLRGAEHWFEYVLAQKEWGKELSWPSWPFTDWSAEGESVTKPLVFMLFIPALVWLALRLWRSIKTPHPMDRWDILRVLSVLFFVGNVLLALFTQKGCLFSQARLLTSTPFFVFLVLDLSASDKSRLWRWGLLVAMLLAAGLCIRMFSKPTMLGCWMVFLLAALVFYGRQMRPWLRGTLTGTAIALNVYWTAYLFNCFLNKGWVFT